MKPNENQYLPEKEAADRLGMSTDDLWQLTLESGRPTYMIVDGAMLYLAADIENMRSVVLS